MLTTLVMAVLAANEVNTVEAEQPKWSVQLSIAAPSIISTSFVLRNTETSGGLGGLGGLGGVPLGPYLRPSFTNALTVERAFGEHWTGVASLSFGGSFAPTFNAVLGGGMVGARWYASRALEGFYVGPSVVFQVSTTEYTQAPMFNGQTYAAGVGARAGWLQRFGAHFMASASAGLNGNLAWNTGPSSAETLNLGVDVALAAGLLF